VSLLFGLPIGVIEVKFEVVIEHFKNLCWMLFYLLWAKIGLLELKFKILRQASETSCYLIEMNFIVLLGLFLNNGGIPFNLFY
jgi:hypothetical protein